MAFAAVLSRPSIAREIANDLPCAVALACADRVLASRLASEITNRHFCVRPCDDVVGVAIGGVMKNVVAIASGIAAGRKLGENARATLVTLGLEETIRFGIAKGARSETFMGLSGIGDMMLTANSLQSRNTSLRVALAEGRSLAVARGSARRAQGSDRRRVLDRGGRCAREAARGRHADHARARGGVGPRCRSRCGDRAACHAPWPVRSCWLIAGTVSVSTVRS